MNLQCGNKILNLDKPKIIAIANYTPDSFYDGGRYNSYDAILNRIDECVQHGADIIDIGVVSSKPGNKLMPHEEEWNRIETILSDVRKKYTDILISVDTYNALTAQKSIDAGANIINDISGGTFDKNMFDVVCKSNIGYVLMHTSDVPEIMQQKTNYNNIVSDIKTFLGERIALLEANGFKNIMIDPGFGFGKTVEQNFELLKNLEVFNSLQKPLLIGLSRKNMIYKTLNTNPQSNLALSGTIALNTIALLKGASILRVHDVKETKALIDLYPKII